MLYHFELFFTEITEITKNRQIEIKLNNNKIQNGKHNS